MKEKRIVSYLWVFFLTGLFLIAMIEQIVEIEILKTEWYIIFIFAVLVVLFFNIIELEDKIKKLGDKN